MPPCGQKIASECARDCANSAGRTVTITRSLTSSNLGTNYPHSTGCRRFRVCIGYRPFFELVNSITQQLKQWSFRSQQHYWVRWAQFVGGFGVALAKMPG